MNDDETVRLAALGNALRPDWPVNSLRTFIGKHLGHRGYGDAAVALAWIATKTQTQTPRLLLEAGVWWQAALIDSPNTAPRFERYDPAACCDVCSKPEHRHGPHDQHPFESVNAATSRRNREDTKQPIRELITTTTDAGTCSGDNEGASL